MPKIIGQSKVVVDHDGLTIRELAGNVATADDTLSIAHVRVSKPTAEPWLTLQYDEWLCVHEGVMELHYEDAAGDAAVLSVGAGETAFVRRGERFRPVFPAGGTSYTPVCLPAFRPERCLREEEPGANDVSKKLGELHEKSRHSTRKDDVLYHMCRKALWEEAVASGKAYFPPTFEEDGHFTHATALPARLLATANHFYTDTEGDWICLELSRAALRDLGIVTKDEGALPVGAKATADEWEKSAWVCPHIYGGIPTSAAVHVLTNIYPMDRAADGTFVRIASLTSD